ncbi:MAG: hypothetical protein E6L00_01270 [Thaumarchaeota archaeon]|nr:MAG: hypothetical protein E6L02_00170 [Nitrososphaerota archaeon]TLX83307.1 MAG: hypothetical protein E6L00_01270 [Nitrososphaerota archaeon]
MKKKKRYLLLEFEEPIEFERFTEIKVISNEENQVVISCELVKLSQVIAEFEKVCKIVNVSGTLKALRRV